MSFIIFNWIIILIGSIHYVFEYGPIISYAISFLSTINSFKLLSSRINIKFNSLSYPIILISFNIVFLILLNLIKNQDIGFYSLKFVQILIFILPAYFLGWNFNRIGKKVIIQSLIFIFIILQFSILIFSGGEISGCIACLDNYVYGMRLVPGINSMVNSLFVLTLIILSLKYGFNKIVNDYDNNEFKNLQKKLSIFLTFSIIFSITVPSRQLFITLIFSIIIFYSKTIKGQLKYLFLFLFGLRSKFRVSLIIYGIIPLILLRGPIYQIFSTQISRLNEDLLQGDSYIRYFQLLTGISLFQKYPILGINTNQYIYGITDLVFENSYIDLLVKTGFIPLGIIFALLIYLINKSNGNKIYLTSKVIFSLLILSFFNEILIEEIFWIPIFFSYGIEEKIKTQRIKQSI